MNKERLIKQLQRHEGLVLKPYRCSAGKLSIGYGRNLEDVGISKAEANMLLVNDIHKCIEQVAKLFCFDKLNDVRQNVLINMCFNLGIYGLKKFKKFLRACELEDFTTASVEMLDSMWSKQVGIRATELSNQMRIGKFLDPK
jgi:lysozyme